MFFFAKFEYWDNLKNEHSRCFGREFTLKDGNSIFAVPSGGDAYQCATYNSLTGFPSTPSPREEGSRGGK